MWRAQAFKRTHVPDQHLPFDPNPQSPIRRFWGGGGGDGYESIRGDSGGEGSRGGEEKGLLDWILGGLQKQDQLLETDPILKKVEEKSGTGGSGSGGSRKTSTVSVPPKKKNGDGGFGGFFSKK
ncbi:hypothetical protein QJS10_CPA03g01856 [Acorus calamus]|uniref:Uncharacterized protein n=1 Tax=Acorus calamus TaxID=4465 RepID=A0AAV9F4X1_ACOCL|nr:hypothetical protein QJS10_CPA03g01856 [Acorus calamus]